MEGVLRPDASTNCCQQLITVDDTVGNTRARSVDAVATDVVHGVLASHFKLQFPLLLCRARGPAVGHCIAARITAHDPGWGFEHSHGRIQEIRFSSHPGM